MEKLPSIHLGVQASQMEKKGIVTERRNINRQIAEDNKELVKARARISRLMGWQKQLNAMPLDLEKANVKASVMNRISNHDGTLSKYRNQRLNTLKSNSAMLNFVLTHNIETVEDFQKKIMELNDSLYALKREIKGHDTAKNRLENNLTLWKEYKDLEPIVLKYDELKGRAKTKYLEKHKDQIERGTDLRTQWRTYRADGGKIEPKVWQRELDSLQNARRLCEWKVTELNREVGNAERVRKALEVELGERTERETRARGREER